VLIAAAAALVATLLAHLLLLSTPRPMVFFGWIVGLITVIVVIFPFRTDAALSHKIATAALYLILGIAIGTLIAGVGERAARVRTVPAEPAGQNYPRQGYQGQTYQGRDY
jgi:MFS-type transporter involved in bile tolerance (Atg22 family)